MVKVKEIVNRFYRFAPRFIAEPNDPVGLQLGDMEHEVKKMMLTLDVRPDVVKEAIENDVDFIFAHHPAMFVPVHQIDLSNPQQKMYADILKHGITVFGAHTLLDNANGGTSDWLAEDLGLRDCEILLSEKQETWYKLAVFVPENDAEKLRNALGAAGAGKLGNYSHCSYSLKGTGRFLPEDAANPYIGTPGKAEEVAEQKVEVVFPAHLKEKVLDAMRKNHPYEEIAFDLYRVEGLGEKYGMGRIGNLRHPMTVKEYAEFAKKALNVEGVRLIAKDQNKLVKKVAVLGGSGSKFYGDALKKGADVYVTGDVTYHTAHDIYESGLAVIDPGHYFESVCKYRLTDIFKNWAKEENWPIEVMTSRINTNPFKLI